jgi:hypothetical protein
LFSVGGGVGSGAWAFWSGGCWAITPGAKSKPTKAVFTGTRRAISTPPQQLRPDGPAIANHYHNLTGGSKTYLQVSFAKT